LKFPQLSKFFEFILADDVWKESAYCFEIQYLPEHYHLNGTQDEISFSIRNNLFWTPMKKIAYDVFQ